MNTDNSQRIKDLLNHPHGEKSIIKKIISILSDDGNYTRLIGIPLIRLHLEAKNVLDSKSWRIEKKSNSSTFGVYEQVICGYPILIYLLVTLGAPDSVNISFDCSFFTKFKSELGTDLIAPMVFKDFQDAIENELRAKYNIKKGVSSAAGSSIL